jgi:hypothetical protein
MVRCGPTMQCASPAFILKKLLAEISPKRKKIQNKSKVENEVILKFSNCQN